MTHTALDLALSAINSSIGTSPEPNVALIAAKCRGLIRGYDKRWRDIGWETLTVEEEYQLPLVNPATGAKSRTFTTAGKYDGMIRYIESGKTYLLEHKTTSEDVSDPSSPYWRRLTIDSQVSHYVLANWQNGRRLDGTVYDVIRKPSIRPRKLTVAEQKVLLQWGTYYGVNVGKQEAASESPELYEIRLAQDCLDEPNKYFQRRVIPRMESEIVEYAQEAWEVGQSILHARSSNAHYRNSGACVQYNSPCEYLGLCAGEESVENSDRWERTSETHGELSAISDSHLNVLTNTRIKCFQTCRRKHQYRYEIGLRRRDEEEREALFFGSLIHMALAEWWLFFKKGSENGNANSLNAGDGAAAEGLAAVGQDEGE